MAFHVLFETTTDYGKIKNKNTSQKGKLKNKTFNKIQDNEHDKIPDGNNEVLIFLSEANQKSRKILSSL